MAAEQRRSDELRPVRYNLLHSNRKERVLRAKKRFGSLQLDEDERHNEGEFHRFRVAIDQV